MSLSLAKGDVTMQRFSLKKDHLALIREAYFSYDESVEFGAPRIDPKRPYGNSDVYGDIGCILGIEPDGDDDDFSTEQKEHMLRIHMETATALQIIIRTGEFVPGEYIKERTCGMNWKPAHDGGAVVAGF